jgi:hypothetical protein
VVLDSGFDPCEDHIPLRRDHEILPFLNYFVAMFGAHWRHLRIGIRIINEDFNFLAVRRGSPKSSLSVSGFHRLGFFADSQCWDERAQQIPGSPRFCGYPFAESSLRGYVRSASMLPSALWIFIEPVSFSTAFREA